ncbi:PREDICTED: olfactory receptor 4C11-like [Elephantulus edwardii]|uniref:olfactory receptor 4C11-like n=1 Tax=Elephantulus edwardii TaxID=28737 RepID=UPI0003F0CC43|nr:PREDICTED: olfactory receptor 4C11-like [Elephantulus edwardii]
MQQNKSVTEFIMIGLTQDPINQKVVFIIFFILYTGTMLGNLLIIVTIKCSQTLGSPMYFFLFYLSFADACFSTSIAPKLMVDVLSSKKVISYRDCMTQVFALHLFGCMEVLVLLLMALDRYVAICKPLRYPTVMRRQVCNILIIFAWIGSFIHATTQNALVLQLPFCGPNLIDHYCCDLQPLLKLACMDTYIINLQLVSNSGVVCSSSLFLLTISYMLILRSLRKYNVEARKKALSTCTSHIIVVIMSLVPCIFIYTRPPVTFPVDKMVTIFYTITTPFLNPFIYTLRNSDVKNAMRKLWSTKITSELR